MKKKLFVIIVFSILLITGFTGCFEVKDTTDEDIENYVEIVQWYQGTYEKAGVIISNGLEYNESAKYYLVNGTARNNAQKTLNSVIIWVKYYSSNDTLLWEDGVLANGKAHNQTWTFHSFYTREEREHFEDVDHVEFDITGEFNE